MSKRDFNLQNRSHIQLYLKFRLIGESCPSGDKFSKFFNTLIQPCSKRQLANNTQQGLLLL
ncbi:unnamed protein product [Schistosoma mattheei]|uniref:Uncharacterized protein n=1 Tax=Schistosoma mattheei TaxID=31246 RepID=A0A3P8J0L2_9TREM|nr:unnamed protein product [Schistosoma mattheei]